MSLVNIFLVTILIFISFTNGLQIPDQQALVGRVFYYRLPISEGHNVTITETSSGSPEGLPRWLELISPSMELVGVPGHEDRRMHFMHVKVISPNGDRMDDVFVLDVIDGPSHPTPQSDCILRLTPQMESVSQVWRLIKDLVPNHRDWLHLFNVNSYWEEQGYRYQITLDQDQCTDTHLGLESKLRSLGLHFHKIRIIKSDWSPQQLDYRRNHRRRHVSIQPTPSVDVWHPYSSSSDILSSNLMEEEMTRIIPSLASPTLMTPSSIFPSISSGQLSPIESSSSNRPWPPLYTTPVVIPSVVASAILPPDMDNEIFPPSFSILATPTLPHFTLTPTETGQLIPSSDVIGPSSSSSSSTTSTSTTSTSSVDETSNVPPIDPSEGSSSSSTSSTSLSTTSSSESSSPDFTFDPVPPNSVNSVPSIRKRIQKLAIYSGSWFKYVIPDDAFDDREDGGTRTLKLSFYLSSDGTSRDSPGANYWIQLDSENQFLYALPTEKDVGKHTFVLIAADSGGAFIEEKIDVIVRQHRAHRAFHHWIGLHSVVWDSVKYPVMIQAAEKLLSRIAKQAFGDLSLDSIYVQKILPEKGDRLFISWTNQSLPLQPCPRSLIDLHFTILADTSKSLYSNGGGGNNNLYYSPSNSLKQILSTTEFKIGALQLTLENLCKDKDEPKYGGKSNDEITVRNPLNLLQIPIGQVFRSKIPNDMFHTTSGTETIGLEIDLLTINGNLISLDGPIGYKKETQEIYALALDPLPNEPQEMMLLAKDPVSGAQVTSPFGVEYVPAMDVTTQGPSKSFLITMALQPQSEESTLILETKFNLIWRLATQLFNDIDPSHILISSFKPMSQSTRSTRSKRGVPQSSSIYYEIIWTNVSLNHRDICPWDKIKSSIIDPIFMNNDLETISRHFEPDFELITISFTPVGNCSQKMNSERLGTPPITVFPIPLIPKNIYTTTSTISPVSVGPSDEDAERAYYMSSIFPALITLVVMLFVALCVVCFLVRYRRNQEKRGHHQINNRRSETDAFLAKGRTPVILEQERHQQHPTQTTTTYGFHYTPTIMPPGPTHQNPQTRRNIYGHVGPPVPAHQTYRQPAAPYY